MNSGYTTVKIPERLHAMIRERLPETDFSTVDEYVAFVLEEVLRELGAGAAPEGYTAEDEEKVKERLRALGYLD